MCSGSPRIAQRGSEWRHPGRLQAPALYASRKSVAVRLQARCLRMQASFNAPPGWIEPIPDGVAAPLKLVDVADAPWYVAEQKLLQETARREPEWVRSTDGWTGRPYHVQRGTREVRLEVTPHSRDDRITYGLQDLDGKAGVAHHAELKRSSEVSRVELEWKAKSDLNGRAYYQHTPSRAVSFVPPPGYGASE